MADLGIVAFGFLLRVPDELLPLESGSGRTEFDRALHHSQCYFSPGTAWIRLASRKNAPAGCTLHVDCSCSTQPALCAACALRRLCSLTHEGRITHLSYATFLRRMRRALSPFMPYREAIRFATHAFRRGGAQAIWDSTHDLGRVLAAGGWVSSAFLRYLQRAGHDPHSAPDLEALAVFARDSSPEPHPQI